MEYGTAPTPIWFDLELVPAEMCFVQYLPIAMAAHEGHGDEIRIPPNLGWVRNLLAHVRSADIHDDAYMYLTVKHIFASGADSGNRPGWHSDGFGTDDVNYIWYDRCPTEFAVQPFVLSTDCDVSMQEMEDQVKPESIVTYPVNTLLRLDQGVVHRSPENCEPGFRTFIKISCSKERYNLKGNAHNYLFDYDWPLVSRAAKRNHPMQDYVKDV